MELKFDDIKIARKFLVSAGSINAELHTISLIRGANGSGKTLLLNNLRQNAVSRGISTVLMNQSKEALVLSADVTQNIAMTLDSDICQKVRERVEQLGFSTLLDKDISRLSGGETRILCILRSILSESDLVLLDEPTNDLDYDTVELVQGLIKEMKREKTIIIVSHDDRMISISDKVYIINNKVLEASGSSIAEKDRLLLDEARSDIPDLNDKKQNGCLSVGGDSNNHRSSFLRKMFIVNFSPLLFCLFFAAFLYYPLRSYCLSARISDEEKPSNQVLLLQETSNWWRQEYEDKSIVGSAFPVEFVQGLCTISPREGIATLAAAKEYLETNSSYSIHHSVDIPSSDAYDVYPLEYYDWYTNESTTVLWTFTNMLCESGQEYRVMFRDTKGYFTAPDYFMDEKGVVFEPNGWRIAANSLESDHSTCCAAYVVMREGHSVDELYNSEAFKQLFDCQVLASSVEIYRALHEVERLLSLKDNLIWIFGVMLAVFLLNACGTCLYILTQRVKIRACCDYGIPVSELFSYCEPKLCSRLPLVILTIAFVIWNSIYVRTLPFMQSNWIFSFLFVITVSLVFYLQRAITRMSLKYLYRWDVR